MTVYVIMGWDKEGVGYLVSASESASEAESIAVGHCQMWQESTRIIPCVNGIKTRPTQEWEHLDGGAVQTLKDGEDLGVNSLGEVK